MKKKISLSLFLISIIAFIFSINLNINTVLAEMPSQTATANNMLSGLGGGVIVAIVLGSIALISALIPTIVYFVNKKNKKNKKKKTK